MSLQYTPQAGVWTSVFTMPKDGEVWSFSTVVEAVLEKLADNAAYLKATAALLNAENTFTDSQRMSSLVVGVLEFEPGDETSGLKYRRHTLGDSNDSIDTSFDVFRIPQITGPREYSLADGTILGQRVRFVRPREADAFAVVVTDSNSDIVVGFASSEKGWAELEWTGSKWVASAWFNVDTITDEV